MARLLRPGNPLGSIERVEHDLLTAAFFSSFLYRATETAFRRIDIERPYEQFLIRAAMVCWKATI